MALAWNLRVSSVKTFAQGQGIFISSNWSVITIRKLYWSYVCSTWPRTVRLTRTHFKSSKVSSPISTAIKSWGKMLTLLAGCDRAGCGTSHRTFESKPCLCRPLGGQKGGCNAANKLNQSSTGSFSNTYNPRNHFRCLYQHLENRKLFAVVGCGMQGLNLECRIRFFTLGSSGFYQSAKAFPVIKAGTKGSHWVHFAKEKII